MKRLSIFFLGMSVIFMIITICSGINSACKNYRLVNNFAKSNDAYPYSDAIESGNLNLEEISNFMPEGRAAMAGPELKEDIISPVTISYYKNINDDIPVYIIEKGEVIHFSTYDRTTDSIFYRSTESLPTNVPGWRLSRPFKVKGEDVNNELLYVKLDDLMDVTYKWIDENPVVIHFGSTLSPIERNKYNVSRYILFYVDRILYYEGVFLSGDMLNPILSMSIVYSLSVSAVSFAIFLYIKLKTRA